jgi:hypothetical protein
MKSYKKYREYKITLASASNDISVRQMFDPRLNSFCIYKDHHVANMRFRKNIRRPNRVRNVKYTMECWNRHLQKRKERK